ncbi:hypothetical protein BDD12DRAFT_896299 [Trichophaea hybrida]|nr:hypothetical protein BDD12DRAFT_896299 [Trichophaea hybrida]
MNGPVTPRRDILRDWTRTTGHSREQHPPRTDENIPPPPPEKKKTIRPTPTPVVPLATQVLKQNLARKQEESQKNSQSTTTMTKEQVEGQPSKTPRLVSPRKSLMHSRHAKGAVEDRKRKHEDERAQAQKSEQKTKSQAGWTEVQRKRGPRGPSTKIDDSRGYTLVCDTPMERYESWRPTGSCEK